MKREQEEARSGRDLEHGDRSGGIGTLAFLEHGGEFLVRHQYALARPAQPEPLVEAHEMRRGINMHAQARRFEDRADERDGRALSIGPGDMNHRRQLAFRMPDRGQQPPHAIERKIDQLGVQREQPLDDGIDGWHWRRLYRNHSSARATLTRWAAPRSHGLGAGSRPARATPAPRRAPW